MKFKKWLEDTTMTGQASIPDPIDNGLSRAQVIKTDVPESDKADELFGHKKKKKKVFRKVKSWEDLRAV